MFLPARFLFTAYVVPNKRAGMNNFINSITEQAKNVRAGPCRVVKNLKIVNEHARLFGSSEENIF